MSTLIVATFAETWALVADLEPDVRSMRLIRTERPVIVHALQLEPADAARLDLGHYEPAFAFDGRERPVVLLSPRSRDGEPLIANKGPAS